MSRNSSGTMVAANGPYLVNTTIDQTVVNARLADIENELTDSLSRSGKGGMTAAMRVVDGSVSAPAHSFTSETGSGLYRIGASDIGMAVAGSKRSEWTANALSVAGSLQAQAAAPSAATPDVWLGAEATGMGLYRSAAHTMKASANGTDVQTWTDTSITMNVPISQEAWNAPSLLNSWVQATITTPIAPGYFKDSQGVVHLRGSVKSGSSAAAVMFTLPVGYRPSAAMHFPGATLSGAYAGIQITAAGNVNAEAGGDTGNGTSLDGITFDTR